MQSRVAGSDSVWVINWLTMFCVCSFYLRLWEYATLIFVEWEDARFATQSRPSAVTLVESRIAWLPRRGYQSNSCPW
jgi:hypothetical protein